MERTRSLIQPAAQRSFQTTRWSVVRRAVGTDDAKAAQALAALCEGYWYPLYAYVRRSGYSPHDAEDLTQGFFARLLEKNVLAAADPEKGKLRTFLLACARHFLADERDRAQAMKRGAGLLTSFDAAVAEERYAAEPADNLSPDRLFQRRWALTILEYSLELLAEEFATQGKAEVFEALRPFLGFGADPAQRYEEIAAAMGPPSRHLEKPGIPPAKMLARTALRAGVPDARRSDARGNQGGIEGVARLRVSVGMVISKKIRASCATRASGILRNRRMNPLKANL
jgi:DNA-directed RNA polymerase specialized sigma24 family protein